MSDDAIHMESCPFCGNTETKAIVVNAFWMLKKYRGRYAAAGCPECGAITRLFPCNNHTGSPLLNKMNEMRALRMAADEWNRRDI